MDEEEFCQYHYTAHKKLQEGLDEWRNALDLDWDQYLLRVYEVEGLGLWIQEVIDYLMLQEST